MAYSIDGERRRTRAIWWLERTVHQLLRQCDGFMRGSTRNQYICGTVPRSWFVRYDCRGVSRWFEVFSTSRA